MNRITVLIADDLPLLVDALTDLLGGDPSIAVVGTANDAVAAVEAAATARPDVALLDVRMPAGGGAAAGGIREVSPGTKIIALSAHFDRASVTEMVRAGAIGYLVKGSAPEEIIAAVRGSVRGESNLSPEVTGHVMQELGRSLARAEELSTELAELNRMKTELVQILAHELFTPITTIQGTAATLAVSEGRLTGEEMRDLADGVERAARRLRRLVANIGAVVSLEREAAMTTQAVPLSSIVDDALGEFGATEEGIIDRRIPDELLISEVMAHQELASRAVVLVTENATSGTKPPSSSAP
jgi:DNA-binding NarL/FixJ family response regulator